MLQLGMDAEGAELRAKMQSASLLSDMESFKAANPGAVLADFVRWHSPRDWEESPAGKGKVRDFLLLNSFRGQCCHLGINIIKR
jgi:hypothetical protein